MLKKTDIILIVAVVILCFGFLAFFYFSKEEGSKVIITVDGKEYDTLSLKEDTEYTIDLGDGSYNTFKITDGYVDMIDASCPDQLCVNQSDIHNNHETIVCLPNRVVLEVIEAEDSEVDMYVN